jgi:tagaturonate reductase
MRYFEKFNELPPLMMRGFAAYLLFTKPVKSENGQFFGQNTEGGLYPIQDDAAAFFKTVWDKTDDTDRESLLNFVEEVLSNEAIFDKNLKELVGFKENIAKLMLEMANHGVFEIVNN